MANLPEVKAQDFGLEEAKAKKILQSFRPAEVQATGLLKVYENILTKEVTPEVELEAAELDKKVRETVKAIDEVHKVEKAFYLAAGRFVDAKRNREKKPLEQIRETLKGIKDFTKNKEEAEAQKIEIERKKALVAAGVDVQFLPAELGKMDEAVFAVYLAGIKAQQAAKEEAEAKAKEAEKVRQKAAEEEAAKTREANAKLQAEKDKLAKELKAKEDAEAAAKAKDEAEAEAKLKMGDKAKFAALLQDLNDLKTKYTFKSKGNKAKYSQAGVLLDKIIKHIE